MSKRSKRMPKLMTLRVGLQAARSHPGWRPFRSRLFSGWNFACLFFRRKQRDEMELPLLPGREKYYDE